MKYYSTQLNFNSCNKIHANTKKAERALEGDTHMTQQAVASVGISDLRNKYMDKKN